MVCNQIQNSDLRAQADEERISGGRLEMPVNEGVWPQKRAARTRKKKLAPAKEPKVLAYTLEEGRNYDVFGTHTSVKSVEYTGYKMIGRLVLYCFQKGSRLYKFSEVAVRQGGGIRDSGTGEEI